MPLAHFTVTQIRAAAACPRVLYFDLRQDPPGPSTLVWIGPEGTGTGCGQLFHQTVEAFNASGARDAALTALVESAPSALDLATSLFRYIYQRHVPQEKLFRKAGEDQVNFMAALRGYVGELAELLHFARGEGRSTLEILDELFGDQRRRVDVTFHVGPEGQPVHVTGVVDFVFHDWRSARHRILDFKLTPSDHSSRDLFQVSIYTLMHDIQHRTHPDAACLYLHPKRELIAKPWESIQADRGKIFDLLASMAAWMEYDEVRQVGLKPPGSPEYCGGCRWNKGGQCERRLGPKLDGARLTHWSAAPSARSGAAAEPKIEVHPLPPSTPPPSPNSSPVPKNSTAQSAALWIGATADASLEVALPIGTLATHVAVVGAAGSGKTWLAKVLAEEAVRAGVPVLAIDPQGDLVQFLKAANADGLAPRASSAHDEYHRRAEPRVFTPGTSHAQRLALNPIRLVHDEELGAIGDPALRDEQRRSVLALIAENLVSLARPRGDLDMQRAFLFALLEKFAVPSVPRLDLNQVVVAVRDPASAGLANADEFLNKTEREKLSRKLFGLLHGPMSSLFAGGDPLDLDQLVTPTAPGRTPLNVIYLNALPDDQQKQFFVASLATEIYRWMITRPAPSGPVRLLLYLDEARDYLPAGVSKPIAKEPLIRLFSQGRKFGVACLVCTQSPRSVDYNIFSNSSSKFIGRLESTQDVDRVREWFARAGESSPEWLDDRRGAASGSFLGRWPGMPEELTRATWTSRPLFSHHGPAWSPDRLAEEWRARSG